MKKYNNKLIIRFLILSLILIGAGFALANNKTWVFIILILVASFIVYDIFRFTTRITRNMKSFIDSIKFSEANISFSQSVDNKHLSDLYQSMNKAVQSFNDKIQKNEADINFYSILLNRIDFAIIIVGDDDKIEWINKSALNVIGRPKPRTLNELGANFDGLLSLFDQLKSGEVKTIKLKNYSKEYHLAITFSAVNIRGIDYRIFSMKNIQTVVDDTETETWQKTIHILTHEIMNSMTPIISLSETFSETGREYDPKMMDKAMQAIYRRSKGLVQFVNNYKKLTHMSAPQKETVNIKEIIEDVYHLLKAQQINFTYNVSPNDIQINIDRGQIEQVIINLIKNAWDACNSSENPEVDINISMDNFRWTIISITDNGLGILPEVMDKIFVPFFTTKKEGSGIGLSICRQIINAHGGTITLKSEPNKGTSVSIRL